jgi:hypothetical protein
VRVISVLQGEGVAVAGKRDLPPTTCIQVTLERSRDGHPSTSSGESAVVHHSKMGLPMSQMGQLFA